MFVEQKTHRDKLADERSFKVCKGRLAPHMNFTPCVPVCLAA